jgi:guanine deaminase
MRLTGRDEHFMRLAIAKAREGIERGQSPFGACVVKLEAVVSCVHNIVWQTTDITAHAEVHALRDACQKLGTINLSGCTIYSTCEPCPMCFSACHWARISRIVYGARIADAQECGFNELPIPNETMKQLGHSPIAVSGDCLRDENRELLASWHQRANRRVY